MKPIKKFALLFLVVILLFPIRAARADAAPPENPPGGDVSPEGGTEVQMVAEQVTIDFRPNTDDSASVSAWFLFHNTSDQPEHLKVRFPLNGDPQWNPNNPAEDYSMIDDFVARIGGQKLPTRTVKDTDPDAEAFFLGSSAVLYWAVFEVDFPAGQDVKLTISYTLRPTEDSSYASVHYLLATGAGWKGPIGKVDVNILFPYILNEYNLPGMNDYSRWDAQLGRTTTVLENQIRFHYDELEPTQDNNVGVWTLQPRLWQAILQCRLRVISLPDDAGAWLNLARAYAAAGQEHHGMFGNGDLALLYIHAMERAITLDPRDASLHAEFAQNMAYADLGGWNDYYKAIVQNEISTALALAPNNADIQSIADEVEQYISITVTTPGPFPTRAMPTPTLELYATPTLRSTETGTILLSLTPPPLVTTQVSTSVPTQFSPQERDEERNEKWLVAFAVLLLIAAGFITWRSTRQKKD
jgi:hypothetical protein